MEGSRNAVQVSDTHSEKHPGAPAKPWYGGMGIVGCADRRNPSPPRCSAPDAYGSCYHGSGWRLGVSGVIRGYVGLRLWARGWMGQFVSASLLWGVRHQRVRAAQILSQIVATIDSGGRSNSNRSSNSVGMGNFPEETHG